MPVKVVVVGLVVFPLYGAGRITVLTVLFSSFLVYNFYTSSIVSSLLVDVPSPFQNVLEFAKSDLELGLESLGYFSTFINVKNSVSVYYFVVIKHNFVLKHLNDSDIQYLYRKKIYSSSNRKGSNIYGQEEGIEKVRQGGFAYQTEASTAYSIVKKTFSPIEICELEELGIIMPFMLSVMTKKNSEYRKLFQIRLVIIKHNYDY